MLINSSVIWSGIDQFLNNVVNHLQIVSEGYKLSSKDDRAAFLWHMMNDQVFIMDEVSLLGSSHTSILWNKTKTQAFWSYRTHTVLIVYQLDTHTVFDIMGF